MSDPFSPVYNHLQCEDITSACQADTIEYLSINELSPVCKDAESSCCGVTDHNVKIVSNAKLNYNQTVGLYDECKCDFWLRLCEDIQVQGGRACDLATEYCCGDYRHDSFAFIYTNSAACYCDFFNYAQNEFGHTLKSQALQVNEEFEDPCGQLEQADPDYRREFEERLNRDNRW